MALLHYEELTGHRPDVLMQKTFYGVKPFYDVLSNIKKYYEGDKAIKRIGWEAIDGLNTPKSIQKAGVKKNSKKKTQQGVWVQLIEPEECSEAVEALFKVFLDENLDSVYEATHSNWTEIGAAAVECPYCTSRNGKPKLLYKTKEHAEEVASEANQSLSVYECDKAEGWHVSKDVWGGVSFRPDYKIKVLDRDAENERLLLERCPKEKNLVIRPNTYTLKCQLNALQSLQDAPSSAHRPLLRLFEATSHARWKEFPKRLFFGGGNLEEVDEWHVLTDEDRKGNGEQQKFVKCAINTPDFAFLEGPPGSGKTTAIRELILQLIKRNKRILLCASTHVAVDNVLERLMAQDNQHRDLVIPVRIGDGCNVSDKVAPWQLGRLIKTERQRVLKHLSDVSNPTSSQITFKQQLRQSDEVLQKWFLGASNLVCGTTIGILQHPEIKQQKNYTPQFDYLIVDEASKTTFQEFLVPALLAKRWVLVGDPKQLSPYVDDEEVGVNLVHCLKDEWKRNACVDIFKAEMHGKQRVCSLVCTDEDDEVRFYLKQGQKNKANIWCEGDDPNQLPYAGVVVASKQYLSGVTNKLPLDISHVRTKERLPSVIERRVAAYNSSKKNRADSKTTWEKELGWRICRKYELRNNMVMRGDKKSSFERYQAQVEQLMPYKESHEPYRELELDKEVLAKIKEVQRIMLPSILESLKNGVERSSRQREGTALSDGLPESVYKERAMLLSYQHRMHPEIAEFSHREIYDGEALFSADEMKHKREWGYKPNRKRSAWVDVKVGKLDFKTKSNPQEAKAVLKELEEFCCWVKSNPKSKIASGKTEPWQVAVLTFYRAQERELRRVIRKWTKQHRNMRHFYIGEKKQPIVEIQICTVDRFQGHEADLVLLSFMQTHPTSFLESPNRLNVALTRARYQIVVFGNREKMKLASGALGCFASGSTWSRTV